MDPEESSSESFHLPPELGINPVGESEKVRNSISCQYLTEYILDVIEVPEVGTQGILTPQQVALWKSIKWWKQKRQLIAS